MNPPTVIFRKVEKKILKLFLYFIHDSKHYLFRRKFFFEVLSVTLLNVIVLSRFLGKMIKLKIIQHQHECLHLINL